VDRGHLLPGNPNVRAVFVHERSWQLGGLKVPVRCSPACHVPPSLPAVVTTRSSGRTAMSDVSSDTPLFDTLAAMTRESIVRCELDANSLLAARIAALAAVDRDDHRSARDRRDGSRGRARSRGAGVLTLELRK
jgi:hypothetical protein